MADCHGDSAFPGRRSTADRTIRWYEPLTPTDCTDHILGYSVRSSDAVIDREPVVFRTASTGDVIMPTNEDIIRTLYAVAEATSKDTAKFISLFADDGYFYDVPGGKKYYGEEIGLPVDVMVTAFPDMHRELYTFYVKDDVVIVELALQGTHEGDLPMAGGVLAPTGKRMDAPCCDVFHLKDGKVTSFHCYNLPSVILQQLGVLGNLQAALTR
ncbi:nuclear transport factor 2 family protein [Methylobacterium frigidaeris]|nr:nuclear transport factor 2 family protein [Methylobacterium frigidaeris]